MVELTVRSEISSTLGLKRANWELEEERRSLLSQGESCCVLLKKKEVSPAKANPKENPSERATVVSEHGEYSPLLSLAASTEARNISIRAMVANDVVCVRRTAMADRESSAFDFLGLWNLELWKHYTLQVGIGVRLWSNNIKKKF